ISVIADERITGALNDALIHNPINRSKDTRKASRRNRLLRATFNKRLCARCPLRPAERPLAINRKLDPGAALRTDSGVPTSRINERRWTRARNPCPLHITRLRNYLTSRTYLEAE